jgi:predicted MPP superfamily phosphohydrolase
VREKALMAERMRVALILFVATAALIAVVVVREGLMIPTALEPASRWLYLAAFLVILPFRVPLGAIFPVTLHHRSWYLPLVACAAAPFAYYALLKGARLARMRLRARSRTLERQPGFSASRREFLTSVAWRAPLVAGAGLGGWALYLEPEDLRVTKCEIPIRDLPGRFDGLRIVQISDTHYGPYVTLPYLESAMRRANALAPDLMLLTGDYVHATSRAIGPGVGVLASLKSRLGAAAVLGNHDHWEGADAVRRAFAGIGVPLIDNARLFLTPSGFAPDPVEGESLCVAGVGDYWEDEVSFEKALGGVAADVPRILLSHNPDSAEDPRLRAYRVDLMLSGHTHGGQVAIPGFGAPILPIQHRQYAAGLCKGPAGPVIVSRGVGMAMLPFRFGVPPEIVQITLRAA